MSRRLTVCGIAVVVALTLGAPVLAGGSATQQGYPSPTAPPGASSGVAGGTSGGGAAGSAVQPTSASKGTPPASAGTGGVLGAQANLSKSHPAGAVAPAQSGALPFTGLQLGLIVLLALGLVGAGAALRTSRRGS
jgi:hypothetical protein